jgi:hypothetical protein
MRYRFVAVAVMVGVFGVVGNVPNAGAAQPVLHDGTSSANLPLLDCGTFEVWDEAEISWSGYLHLDRDGNPVQIVQHLWGSDRLYNPDNGATLRGTFNANEIVDLVDGQAIEDGQVFRILMPGAGVVLLDVGRFVIDFDEGFVFLKGRHQFFEGDVDALCAALS